MTIQLINPADLPPQATYTQVVVAAGTAMVFISGQEPEDVHGNSVAPGDLAGQARQVYANLGRALTAAGARPDQVAKLTIYVAGCTSACLPVIEQARVELFGQHKPADTLIGVARSAGPGPARVPHRGRRDRGEVRTRQLPEEGVPAERHGLVEPPPGQGNHA
jgi:enamine deaminase RidA (YjgF/YER057c/UK114 family)